MTKSWNLSGVAETTNGEIIGEGNPEITGFTTDSREVREGDLFIGIAGENVNGGLLARAAVEAGASAALIDQTSFDQLGAETGSLNLVVCEDTREALGRLGGAARKDLRCPVIGVTGSTGKTSTKDILGAILAGNGSVFVSAGNRNTEIGMPLELLTVPDGVGSVVLEMAMRGEGQIAELVTIAEPDAGLIVNVGPVHLETLGSIERVAAAKCELIAGLRPDSVCVVPAGDSLIEPYLRDDLDTVTFGPGGDCRLVKVDGRFLTIEFRGEMHRTEVSFDQPHNRLNLLAAAGVALGLGFKIPDQLTVDFSGHRGQRRALDRGVVVIDDCYNANPMSMHAALADLAGESDRRGGRKVAVLGDMLELGAETSELHRQLGVEATAAGVDILVTVGELSSLAGTTFDGRHLATGNAAEAAAELLKVLESGDTVLIKASRGVGLEAVTSQLEEEWS